jgi:hypothetical protein
MWVYPDLITDQQWTADTKKIVKGKVRASTCNAVGVSTVEEETNTTSITESEEEEFIFNTEPETPLAGTRSGRQFSKNYGQAVASSSNPLEKMVEPPTKKKELRFNQPLRNNDEGVPSKTFHFDVMAQLANIPARITLHELLRLSKTTRDALREALADAEVFATYVQAIPEGV